jgi:Rad3-related DNA helicase
VGDLVETNLVRACRTAIFTGATLRTGTGFDFMRERLGLWDAEASIIPSPFDYRRSTLLYMPSDLPEPNRPGYQQAVEQAILQAALTAGGRTLVLFTSYSHLRATAVSIRGPLEQMGITMLQHGTSSRRRLLLAYRNTEHAVLLGTRSFWEGVDLAGDLLSCLVIARLPFAVPTDPIVAARGALYDNAFSDYTLPDAVIRFRQGFGRLIRRASDRGVVLLLDSRVWRRGYGSAFLDALPTCTTRRGPLADLGKSMAQWLYE